MKYAVIHWLSKVYVDRRQLASIAKETSCKKYALLAYYNNVKNTKNTFPYLALRNVM